MVILRTTPHWSVRMTSCSFRLLTWEQQMKITFAACVRTNDKFQIIMWDTGIHSLTSSSLGGNVLAASLGACVVLNEIVTEKVKKF